MFFFSFSKALLCSTIVYLSCCLVLVLMLVLMLVLVLVLQCLVFKIVLHFCGETSPGTPVCMYVND